MDVSVVSRRAGQTKDDVREVLRVRVGDDPAGFAERVDEGAIEAHRITAPKEKTGKHKEYHHTRDDTE